MPVELPNFVITALDNSGGFVRLKAEVEGIVFRSLEVDLLPEEVQGLGLYVGLQISLGIGGIHTAAEPAK